jgi:hypothetical protein
MKAKKGYKILEITEAQLIAIINTVDTLSGMRGCMDEDFNKEADKDIRLIDRFLKKNGYKRVFS